MFSLTRRRREAERNKKLEDAFREADVSGNGKINKEQMIKLFAVNDVVVPNLDEEMSKIMDRNGEIKFGDFMKFAQGTDLHKIEYHDRVFHKCDLEAEVAAKPRKESTKSKKLAKARAEANKVDKIELAFRKFDLNKDGFLNREEFDTMMKDVDKAQADRIFKRCDRAGDGKISLEEFRNVIEKGKEMMK